MSGRFDSRDVGILVKIVDGEFAGQFARVTAKQEGDTVPVVVGSHWLNISANSLQRGRVVQVWVPE